MTACIVGGGNHSKCNKDVNSETQVNGKSLFGGGGSWCRDKE